MAVLSQKDIIEIVRANIEIMEEIIETIDDTIYLKDKKNYDEEAVKDHMKFLYGDPDKPDSSGKPSGLISELVIANDCLTKLAKVKAVKPKAVKKSAEAIVNSINTIIGVVESMTDASKLKNLDEITKSFQNVSKIVDCMWETAKNICKLALIAPVLIFAVLLAIASVVIIMLFVWIVTTLIQMIKAQITKEQLETFERLRQLCWHLIVIDLQMIILALLAPIAAIAAVIALLGMVVLALAVVGICYLLRFMVKMIRKVYDDLSIVAMFFIILILLLLGIALGLMVIGMIAIVVIELIGPIALFLVTTIVLVLILVALGFIMSKVKNQLLEAVIGLAIIAAVMIALFIVAVLLMLIALMAQVIMNNIGNLIGFFVTFIVITVLLIAIGFALGMLVSGPQAAVIGMALVGMAIVIGMLTELVVIATLLLVLSLFNLDRDKIIQTITDIAEILLTMMVQMALLAVPWFIVMNALIMLNLGLLMAILAELIVAATELRILQIFNLDGKKINKTITTVILTLYGLMAQLSILAIPELAMLIGMVMINFGLLLGVVAELIIAATELRILQAIDLNAKKINKNIVTTVSSLYLLGMSLAPLAIPYLIWVLEFMTINFALLLGVVGETLIAAKRLKEIQDLELKKEQIEKNINIIFDCVDLLFERFGDKTRVKNLKKIARKAKRMLKQVIKCTERIMIIVEECLQKLMDIQLKQNKIEKNINIVFDCVDLLFERFGNKAAMKKRKKAAKQAKRMLKHVVVVVDIVKGMVDTMNTIQDIKLKDKRVRGNIEVLLDCIDYMFGRFGDKSAMKKRKKAAKRAKKMLEHVGKVVSIIGSMVETLNSIQEFKLKQDKIYKNFNIVWETVENIEQQIKSKIPDDGGGLKGFVKGLFRKAKQRRRDNEFLEKMGRIGKIVEVVGAMCETLNSLQEIKLKEDKIFKQLDIVWSVVENIEQQIKSKIPDDGGGLKGFFKGIFRRRKERKQANEFLEKMGRIGKVVEVVGAMCETLNSLQEIKLDKSKILDSLDVVWAVVEEIENEIKRKTQPEESGIIGWFKNYWKRKREARAAEQFAEQMGRIGKICESINGMITMINSLQEMKIDKDSVITKLSEVFEITNTLEKEVRKFTSSVDHDKMKKLMDSGMSWNLARLFSSKGSMESRQEKMDAMQEFMGPMAEVASSIGTIISTLDQIQNVTISESKVTNMIQGLFNFINGKLIPMITEAKIDGTVISKVEESVDSITEIIDQINSLKGHIELLKEITEMGISKSAIVDELRYVLAIIPGKVKIWSGWFTEADGERVCDFMFDIKDFYKEFVKINAFLPDIKKFGSSQLGKFILPNSKVLLCDVMESINAACDRMKWNERKSMLISKLVDNVEEIQDVLSDFNVTNTQVDNQKKMTENYIKFLDKIDKVNPENLKTSVSLFEQMARLSESIQGNFEGLAQTINEKIAPLLEELNKLLEEIPEKIGEKTGGSESSSDDSGSSSKDSKKEDKKEKKNEKDLNDVVSKLSSILSSVNAIKGLVD